MQLVSIEQEMCSEYLERSEDECRFPQWITGRHSHMGLLVAEGFEKRSLGVLQRLAKRDVDLEGIVIGRYVGDRELNRQYRPKFEELAEVVAPGKWSAVENRNDGAWVQEGLDALDCDEVILDISGISNRGLFQALDAAAESPRSVYVGYSEAKEYWPKKSDWQQLKKGLADYESLADLVDSKPWLFGLEHKVETIPGHEGYDAAGAGRALVGFLPFKCARLAAILGEEDYSEFLFIAGSPHLKKNGWRLKAQEEINEPATKGRVPITMGTFGYRSALDELAKQLLSEESLLWKYDVHMAILGSKLQTVACWVFSRIVRSITVVTSVPARYYKDAFSEGIGESWIFRLARPEIGP